MGSTAKPVPFPERLRIGASLLVPFVVLWIASRSGWLPITPWWFLAAMPVAVVGGLLMPQVFSGWYRVFSSVQSWVGRRLFAVLLGIIFILVLIPIGIALRACGKSFLDRSRSDSYWRPTKASGSLRQQF